MKSLSKFFIIVFSIMNCYGQTKEPTAMPFVWKFGTTTASVLNPLDTQFRQTEFLTGFQWGYSTKMNMLLKNNTAAGDDTPYDDTTAPNYSKSIQSIKQASIDGLDNARQPCRIAPAMVYDPSLQLDYNQKYMIRQNDSSNTIFGFRYRNSNAIYGAVSDENYSRIQLNNSVFGNNSTPPAPVLVLSNISEQPQFQTYNSDAGHQAKGYYGQKWFVSLNLRRLSTDANNTQSNQEVLKVRVKYVLNDSSIHYFKFKEVPSTTANDTIELLYSRGIEQKRENNGLADKTFFSVYASAIPLKNSLDSKKDITLTGYFTTGGQINPTFADNPMFSSIKSIDIEVYYNGVVDVGIDWVKIESINAYYLSRGYFDDCPNGYKIFPSVLVPSDSTLVYGFKQVMQARLSKMNQETITTPQGTRIPQERLFRLFGQDAEATDPHYWFQLRYLNLLTNGLAITRDLPYLTEAYDHYTKAPNRYLGIKLSERQKSVPAPWVFRTAGGLQDLQYGLGMKWGSRNTVSKYTSSTTIPTEPLNSGYETDLYRSTSFQIPSGL